MEEESNQELNSFLEKFLEEVSFNNHFGIRFFKKSELEEKIKTVLNEDSINYKVDYQHKLSIAIHYLTNNGWERFNLEGINEPCYKYFNYRGF